MGMRSVPAAVAPCLLLRLAVRAAHAERAPCIPGQPSSPTCQWWDAKVTLVADGDTVEANIKGVGQQQVRFIGINAMELTRYSHTPSKRRGDCHGLEAAAFVDKYMKPAHYRVRLAAEAAPSRSGRRLRRSVWVKSGGRYIDLAKAELAAGHA